MPLFAVYDCVRIFVILLTSVSCSNKMSDSRPSNNTERASQRARLQAAEPKASERTPEQHLERARAMGTTVDLEDDRRLTCEVRYPTGYLHNGSANETRPFLVDTLHNQYAIGEPLRDEHVTRPANGCHFTNEELMSFRNNVNREGCPTFGSCIKRGCMHAGPVGDPCALCRNPQDRHCYYRPIRDLRHGVDIWDSVVLATYVGHACPQWPVGQRYTGWIRTPIWSPEEMPLVSDLVTIARRRHGPDVLQPGESDEAFRIRTRIAAESWLRKATYHPDQVS